MKFPESVQGHPRTSPGCQGGFKTPQRSILRCPGTPEMIKLEKFKISLQTEGLGYYMSTPSPAGSNANQGYAPSPATLPHGARYASPPPHPTRFSSHSAARSSPHTPPPQRPAGVWTWVALIRVAPIYIYIYICIIIELLWRLLLNVKI